MKRQLWRWLSGSLLLSLAALSLAAQPCGWPAWEQFRDRFISAEGRVIDPATTQAYTTSEGQAYALFFALVANDQRTFKQLLTWSSNNLADGDLTAHLPAWQWGRRPDGQWGVVDSNSASDADLWLAYTLSEAGRLWDKPAYTALGKLIAARIEREESALLPGLGYTLLPAPQGFHPSSDTWRLNPSYLPLPLAERMAALWPNSQWPQIVNTGLRLQRDTALQGFAPDWVIWHSQQGWQPDKLSAAVGSYDAIRVYLWSGMLDADHPAKRPLLRALHGMTQAIKRNGVPPLSVNTLTGHTQSPGPTGFSAALLPMLSSVGDSTSLQLQLLRLSAQPSLGYYDNVLSLFGTGWLEQRYAFGQAGLLKLNPCAQSATR